MLKISAFADEISDDLETQLQTLQANGVTHIELRGVWGKNVMDLSEKEIRQVKQRAQDSGIGFSAVGSPLGKYPIDGELEDQLEGLKIALNTAQILEAPYIRMFSFFMPPDEDPALYRGKVLDWLGRLAAEAEKTPIILAHENERGIYGDTGERVYDIFSSLHSPALTGIFDFANFVQCGQHAYADCWQKLQPWMTYFHIKDAVFETRQVVPAGQGDGDVAKILTEAFAAGFDNFLTLEPHLSIAAAHYGRTTPELFQTAANALRTLLAHIQTIS